jgi:hypothetical protein
MRKSDIGFDQFKAEWNDGLDGYVITFNDGRVAQTQTIVECKQATRRLRSMRYLERYTDYDDELTDDQQELVDYFISTMNELEGNAMYEITVKKAGSIYELRVSSKRAVSKPRYFKSAELAITEANSLAGFYNNATVTLEV